MKLVAEGLSLKASEQVILQASSFSIASGEVVALLGPSGSGKSLTLKALLGWLPEGIIQEGQIRQEGLVGYLDQDAKGALNPLKRVGAQLQAVISRYQRKESVEFFLKQAGFDQVEALQKLYPHQLSGGMAQRVALARVLAQGAGLWLADECTSGLDLPVQQELLKLFRQKVISENVGLLFVTHDHRILPGFADRVLQLVPASTGFVIEEKPLSPPTAFVSSVSFPAKSPLVEIRALQARLAHFALGPLDLSIHQGEVVGLVGASGAGKTTLVRLLLGVLKPSGGTVRVCGMDPADSVLRPQLSHTMQALFQDAGASLNPGLTVAEIIQESGVLFASEARIPELLARLGLQARSAALPSKLSGGEKRRVTLAQARLAAPVLLVADEPTSGLDARHQQRFLEDVLANRRPEQAFLLVSHDLVMLMAVCTRLLVLHQGQLVDEFTPSELHDVARHLWTKQLARCLEVL
jgi:ABC-type glutathione transport system ATPase component